MSDTAQPNEDQISFSSSEHSNFRARKKRSPPRQSRSPDSQKSAQSSKHFYQPDPESDHRAKDRSRSPEERDRDRYRERKYRDEDRGDYRRRRPSPEVKMPPSHKPMFSYKDFESFQDYRVDRALLKDAYNDYQANYKRDQEYYFYKDNRHRPWFLERYDPSQIVFWKQAQAKLGRLLASKFKEAVFTSENGLSADYHQLLLEQDKSFDYNRLSTEDGADADICKAPLCSFDTDTNTLYLKYIPVDISRKELLEVLSTKLSGFLHLSMSEPMRNHNFERLAWATFQSEHDAEQALQQIPNLEVDGFQLSAAKSHPNKKRVPIRICPPMPEEGLSFDYEMCKLLITKIFDPEKEIEPFIVEAVEAAKMPQTAAGEEAQPEPLPLSLKLDLLLLYLRRVHSFCLYCGEEFEDERMLATRCGPQHIRNWQRISKEEFEEIAKKNDNPEEAEGRAEGEISKSVREALFFSADQFPNWGGSITFLKKYLKLAVKRVEAGPRQWIDPEEEFIEADKVKFCKGHCQEIEKDQRYKCMMQGCQKKFESERTVVKHIQKKHADIIKETYSKEDTIKWISKRVREKIKKETKLNFEADENKLFTLPTRKYDRAETSYYGQQRQQENENRGRGRFRKYVDYDAPEANKQRKTQMDDREMVDYSDLFG